MPHTVTSPTLVLCDQLVTYLSAQWGPSAPNLVERRYLKRFDLKNAHGRQVVVFPVGYMNSPSDRGHDSYEHTVRIVTFEKYPDALQPDETVPQEWVDVRVDFVNQFIVEGLDFTHEENSGGAGVAPFNKNLKTLATDVPEIYSAELLEQKGEFWCAVDCVFEELRL